MHRTQSLDYGVVIEGEVEMVLDDGVSTVMGRGDVAVQRGTSHGWRNVSKTEWARMFFVLQEYVLCHFFFIDFSFLSFRFFACLILREFGIRW